MKHKRLKLTAVFLLAFSLTSLHAQTSFNATGSNAKGNGGTVSYTVGQSFYQNYTGSGGEITQGVQQPYEIFTVGIDNVPNINLNVLAYPNPTSDYLQLKVESEKIKDLSYQLFDISGKLLQTKKITETETQINMSSYVPASYFVKVMNRNKPIKEFKIIKN